MNFGTFQGAGTGALGGSITRYTQTPTITTSQTIPVPNGVQRIEALLVGGGGGGGNAPGAAVGGGGGFGGAAVIEIPVTGQWLLWQVALVAVEIRGRQLTLCLLARGMLK